MKHLIIVLAAVFPVLIASNSYSQSLGDLAKKEKERRQQIKSNVKVITNDDSSKYKSGPITTVNLPQPPPTPDAEKEGAKIGSGTAKPSPDEPVDLQGRPEGWWRQTLGDARKKVKELENEGNVLTLKLADLQNKFYREDDGFKQQTIGREINKTFYEQDLNKENLSKAKKELEDLEKEARKSGALPGWLIPR